MKEEFNTKVRLEDDLYSYVNGKWIEKAKLPDDKPSVGGFNEIVDKIEKTMIKELNTLSEKGTKDELLSRAVSFYKKILDENKRITGTNFLKEKVAYLDNIKSKEDFVLSLYYLYDNNYFLPFVIGINEDLKDATKYSLILTSPDVILPDTTMYGTDQGNALLEIYKNMSKEVLDKLEISNAEDIIQKALSFDARLSKIVKSREEWAEYVKYYNPYDIDEINKLLSFDIKPLIISRFGKIPAKVIVFDPKFLENYQALMENHLDEYLAWSKLKMYMSNVSYLSEELRFIASTFSRALSGTKEMVPLEKYAYGLTDSYFGEVLGVHYGKKYFGEEAKNDVIDLVKNLITTYKERLSKNTWLSKETIKKAILKLDTMEIKIGYPDKIQDKYYALVFSNNASLVEIIDSLKKIKNAYSDALLYKPVDRSVWIMSANTVNACYNPSFNDITFPAAILSAPFYSIKQSVEENYGGIGTIIGHEISHAFDNNGAQMDEKGNISNWRKEEDYAHFKEKTELMIKQFDGLEIDGGTVNGKLTVSENIADNGGITSSLASLKRVKPDADLKNFFINYTRIRCQKMRPEYMRLILKVDVHSPSYYRANMQVKNFKEFYEAFNIQETDKMYLAPEKRIIIW